MTEIRRIDTSPDIMASKNRSLLLALRRAAQLLRTDPDRAEELLALAHADARQIIEDADLLILAVRSSSPDLWCITNNLAESIEGEIEADDAADEAEVDAEVDNEC